MEMARAEQPETSEAGNNDGVGIATTDESTDSNVTCSTTTSNCGNDGQQNLDHVLGLRCLSIVLSYLEECEGTSLLLCKKRYWNDTILPLLRVPPESTATKTRGDNVKLKPKANENEKVTHQPLSLAAKKKKFTHRMSGRNHKPVVKIPDASTRLDRLNTRRWNIRQRRKCGGCIDTNGIIGNDEFTTAQLAAIEWKETLTPEATEEEVKEAAAIQDNAIVPPFRRLRSIMNPPLLRFYDGQTVSNSRTQCFKDGITCLASYPRSGNTLLRSLLETTTGFCTSSDTRPDRNLSVALAEKPPFFCGEGLAPNTIDYMSPFLPPQTHGHQNLLAPPPICKTHWPERIGCHTYDCQRVVLLVRNPFDATDSYWHMSLTNTHTEKVDPSVTEEHLEFYRALVRHEILQVWMGFLDYYWKECSHRKIPLLLVRYEDLVLSPKCELQRILEFCCNRNENNREDWWKRRLEEVTRYTDVNHSSSSSSTEKNRYGYQSSSTAANDSTAVECTKKSRCSNTDGNSGSSSHPSIGKSLRKGGNISPSLLKVIHDYDHNGWLERLGYHVYRQDFPNNLDRLPPIPVLDCDGGNDAAKTSICTKMSSSGSLTINAPVVSLELRSRDSPYGRNMTHWRRKRTKKDTQPFPTV